MKNNFSSIEFRRRLDNQAGPAHMYHQLKIQDPAAVSLLCEGIKHHLLLKKHRTAASTEDLEELANDAAVLVLQKISGGAFHFFGVSPMCFAHAVADNLVRNFCRKKHMKCLEMNEQFEPMQQPEVEAYLAQKDMKNQVETALSKLSKTSQSVIRLKYFEGLNDEEIVRFGLSSHRTTDSLKSARCRSIRRLAGLMKER